jgi:hypothetical protein
MSLLEQASLVVTPNGYKASKLYSVIPSTGAGDMNVVRATTATRVNSAGLIESVAVNVPRIDYTNGSCPSILVEPQRTNINLYSEDLTNAFYGKTNCTISSNSVISPDGTQNADTATFASGGQFNYFYTFSGNTNVTFSFFIKKGNYTSINVLEQFYFGSSITFNLDTKTASGGTAKVEDYGNGWLRCSWVQPYGPAQTIISWRFAEATGAAGFAYFYGFQAEAGSYATSYIPTTSASVTRNADVISKTGISSLIGQTEGTIFFDGKINALPVDGSLFGIQKNASNFVIRFGSQGTNIYAQSYNGSANLFFETTPYTLGSRVKAAFAYKAGSYAFYINGVQIATGSNATAIPACDATMFNSLWGNFTDALSFYSASGLWKTRLTNAELIELTTL